MSPLGPLVPSVVVFLALLASASAAAKPPPYTPSPTFPSPAPVPAPAVQAYPYYPFGVANLYHMAGGWPQPVVPRCSWRPLRIGLEGGYVDWQTPTANMALALSVAKGWVEIASVTPGWTCIQANLSHPRSEYWCTPPAPLKAYEISNVTLMIRAKCSTISQYLFNASSALDADLTQAYLDNTTDILFLPMLADGIDVARVQVKEVVGYEYQFQGNLHVVDDCNPMDTITPWPDPRLSCIPGTLLHTTCPNETEVPVDIPDSQDVCPLGFLDYPYRDTCESSQSYRISAIDTYLPGCTRNVGDPRSVFPLPIVNPDGSCPSQLPPLDCLVEISVPYVRSDWRNGSSPYCYHSASTIGTVEDIMASCYGQDGAIAVNDLQYDCLQDTSYSVPYDGLQWGLVLNRTGVDPNCAANVNAALVDGYYNSSYWCPKLSAIPGCISMIEKTAYIELDEPGLCSSICRVTGPCGRANKIVKDCTSANPLEPPVDWTYHCRTLDDPYLGTIYNGTAFQTFCESWGWVCAGCSNFMDPYKDEIVDICSKCSFDDAPMCRKLLGLMSYCNYPAVAPESAPSGWFITQPGMATHTTTTTTTASSPSIATSSTTTSSSTTGVNPSPLSSSTTSSSSTTGVNPSPLSSTTSSSSTTGVNPSPLSSTTSTSSTTGVNPSPLSTSTTTADGASSASPSLSISTTSSTTTSTVTNSPTTTSASPARPLACLALVLVLILHLREAAAIC